MKHAFYAALEGSVCGTCNTSGCQTGHPSVPGLLRSLRLQFECEPNRDRLTRVGESIYRRLSKSTANNHSGHSHHWNIASGHRWLRSDLNPAQNSRRDAILPKANNLTPHEYAWCQSHPGQCNMYNNASYRRFNVSGSGGTTTHFLLGSTVRDAGCDQGLANARGATVNQDRARSGKRRDLVYGLQGDQSFRLAFGTMNTRCTTRTSTARSNPSACLSGPK